MTAAHRPVLEGIRSTPLSDEDLRAFLTDPATWPRGRRSLTARTPVVALQEGTDGLLLRTNVQPLLERIANLSPAPDRRR